MDANKAKFKTWFVVAVVGVATLLVALLCYPLVSALFQADGEASVEAMLKEYGIWATFLFLLLQIAQIVIAFIPGEPFPAIGAMLFGEDMALLLCLAGCLLGTMIVYCLVRRFGKPLVSKFVPEGYFEKYHDILCGKKIYLLIFIVFLLPGLPKDVLTYLAAFYPMIKPARFFALTTIGRAPAIAMTIYLGRSLWQGNMGTVAIVALSMLLLLGFGVAVKKHLEGGKGRGGQA